MVGAQNLQVAQLIPHAQHVVCLKLVAVAGAADTLKVFAAVWIPCPQSPNESCRNDVVHVAPSPGLREIYFAKLHFASSSKCRDSMIFPTPARWALAGHFRSTPSQRTGFFCVLKRALQNWHRR